MDSPAIRGSADSGKLLDSLIVDELNSDDIARLAAWVQSFQRLDTPRLYARPLRAGDDQAIFDALKDPRIHRSIAGFEFPFSLSSVRRWLVQRFERMETGEGMYAAILHRGSDMVIGHFGTKIDAAAGGMEVGLAINELYWGKGFVAALCFALASELFAAGAPSIVATCAMENWSSMRVLLAMNFAEQGTKTITTPQGERPSRFFRLRPEAWRKLRLMPLGDALDPDEIRQRRLALVALCRDLKSAREVMSREAAPSDA